MDIYTRTWWRACHLSQPTISHHLKVLYDNGLLDRDKHGAWVYYRARMGALASLTALIGNQGVTTRRRRGGGGGGGGAGAPPPPPRAGPTRPGVCCPATAHARQCRTNRALPQSGRVVPQVTAGAVTGCSAVDLTLTASSGLPAPSMPPRIVQIEMAVRPISQKPTISR
jgi:hypothetical protein